MLVVVLLWSLLTYAAERTRLKFLNCAQVLDSSQVNYISKMSEESIHRHHLPIAAFARIVWHIVIRRSIKCYWLLFLPPFPYDFPWFFLNWVLVSTVQETVLKSAVICMPCQAVSRHGIPGSIWYLVKTPEKITSEDKVSFIHRMHVGISNSWSCNSATILTNLCCLVNVLQKKQLWVKASIFFLLFIYIFFPFENYCNSILFSLSLQFLFN